MNWTEILTDNIPQIVSGVALLFSGGLWLDTRMKRAALKSADAAAKGDDASATQKIVDLYQESIDDLEKRYKKRYNEMEQFYKERLENMKSQIKHDLEKTIRVELKKEYDKRFDAQDEKIKSLTTNLKLWKTKYRNLYAEFEEYKKRK